ncbi:hypothetical protein HN51_018101 [Arachis hypogaea]
MQNSRGCNNKHPLSHRSSEEETTPVTGSAMDEAEEGDDGGDDRSERGILLRWRETMEKKSSTSIKWMLKWWRILEATIARLRGGKWLFLQVLVSDTGVALTLTTFL